MKSKRVKLISLFAITVSVISLSVVIARMLIQYDASKREVVELSMQLSEVARQQAAVTATGTINVEETTNEKVNIVTEKTNTVNTEVTKKKNETPVTKNETEQPEKRATNKRVICIDPGHQTRGNSAKEPIGPGATETKAKVTGGATGVATGQTEYQLNLDVSLKLRDALESKGYTVIMTRTTNNVDMSNSERAKIANDANAAAFIRIHANSIDSSSVKGVLTMCQTSSNPYNGNLASESYKLSKAVLDNFTKETGAVNKGVTRTDTMSGINWCTVPTTIVEMGFLSNPEEDRLMATEDYQNKMVKGIVEGIEQYLK